MKKSFFNSLQLLPFLVLNLLFFQRGDAQNYTNAIGTAGQHETFHATLPLGGYIYAIGSSYPNNPATINSAITKTDDNSTLTLQWTKEFAGPQGESLGLTDIQESLSGNLIVIGNVFPGLNGQANNRFIVMEVHAGTGMVLQSKIIARAGSVRQLSPNIVRVNDCGNTCGGGGYIVTSWSDVTGSPDNVFAMKLDYGLGVLWANDYDTGGDDEPSDLISTAGGGAIIAGSSSTNGWQNFLLELDCQGNIVAGCTKGLKPTAGHVFLNYGIERALNGDILICGAAQLPGTDRRATAARISGTTCLPVWSKVWDLPNLPHDMVFTGITQLAKTNGHVFAAGYTADLVNGGFEPRVVKFNFSNGATNYYRDLGGAGGSLGGGIGISATSARVVVPAGKTYAAGVGHGLTDAFLTAQPSALNLCAPATTIVLPNLPLTATQITFTQTQVPMTVVSHCNVSMPTWAAKDVCAVSNKPARERTGAAVENRGFEMYPNPANESVEIVFADIERVAGQPLQIMDLNGKVLKTQPLDGEVSELLLDVSDLPKGIYLVKIGDAAVQKLTKM